MLLASLMIVGGAVGSGLGAFEWWMIARSDAAPEEQIEQGQQQQQTGRPVEPKVEPKPNIILVGYGKRHIGFDPATQTFVESDTGILSLLATFRNAHEPGKEIVGVTGIRAHIGFEPFDFYKKLDHTIPGFASVEEGIWLNEKSPVVDFDRGEAKTLVIAIEMEKANGYGGFDAFQHSYGMRPDGTQIFLPRIPKLSADKYVVKVEITGGERGEIADLNHLTVTLRPEFNISFP